jgi:hypothetical protein
MLALKEKIQTVAEHFVTSVSSRYNPRFDFKYARTRMMGSNQSGPGLRELSRTAGAPKVLEQFRIFRVFRGSLSAGMRVYVGT